MDGRRNPELLMAWELMDYVAEALAAQPPARAAAYVQRWRERGAAIHLGHDEIVAQLRTTAGTYIDATAELRDLQLRVKTAEGSERETLRERAAEVNRSLCALRADALLASRRAFGRENFGRFLYEAVAPDVVIVSSVGSSPDATRKLWQWAEAGCR